MQNLKNEEIEYLTECIIRVKKLSRIIFNESFYKYPANIRFGILRDLYGVYSEIYSMKFFEEVHNHSNHMIIDFSTFQKSLYKMIRNVFSHFPFFDSWDEVWVKRDFVILNVQIKKDGTYNSSIEQFFNKYTGKQYAIRITEYGGNQIITNISVPKGYQNNDKIYLKEIVDERYIGILSVGYFRIILNNFLATNGLNYLVIPLVETVTD